MKKILPVATLFLLVAFCLVSFQKKSLTVIGEGKVVSNENIPLSGVKVFLEKKDMHEGSPYYTASNDKGEYSFQFNAMENQLIILRFVKKGFADKTIKVHPGSKNLRFKVDPVLLSPQPPAPASVRTVSVNR